MDDDRPNPAPMRRNARANRERILDAAEEVFGTDGALGSTEQVARRANVGIATVFRHFPTKQALIEAALVRHLWRLEQHARELAQQRDPTEALRHILSTVIETGATKLTLASQITEPGHVPDAVLTPAQALRARIGEVLDRAKAAGAVEERVTVDELYMLIGGLSQVTATSPSEPSTLNGAIEIIWRGITARR